MRKKIAQSNAAVDAQSGNALIYVLIAIVLFAALGFTLTRQTQNSSTREIDEAKAELYATQIISYSAQAKSVVDQMIITGSDLSTLDLTKPGEAGFNTAPHIHKVFHPQGGGLTPANLPPQTIFEISSPPSAGWYLGQFNNVEWTSSNGTDAILTAYQIKKSVCETINEKITGSKSIPALSGNMNNFLIDTATNQDLTVASCAACEGYTSLCVSNSAISAYSFYTVLADR